MVLHAIIRYFADIRRLIPTLFLAVGATAFAGEPDPKTYWNVDDIRPGMKGTGQTVMVGTKLEEFGAEVLGVMKGVSPGRDMVLCRLTGCNLEHAGIIQGMSGSPIYIDGKLLGAVAFAWEFAKDPIAGVTPFSQMVQYVRSNDKRIAAESELEKGLARSVSLDPFWRLDESDGPRIDSTGPMAVSGGGLGGMRAIATPLAASGFTPRALAFLSERFQPIGLAPMAGGKAQDRVIKEEGDKLLVPGAPLSIGMVTGDFDLSGIGTVTHVEGDRVYGFGHPMFSLGACQFPMMTGYIHTVYPRASVSMKMGSPLKVVGVLDTDVSTGIAGRIGPKPDMIPLSVKVKTGRYAETRTFHVEVVREPNLLPNLVMAVLTNAVDTEGNLPDELTAKIGATIQIKGHDPIVFKDVLSGPRYSGATGPSAMFSPIAGMVNMLVRNSLAPIRIESIDCSVEVIPGRTAAVVESVRLASDRVEPGAPLQAFVTIKPFKGDREVVEVALSLPDDFPEGTHEAFVCDLSNSLRRRFKNEPQLLEPRDGDGLIRAIRSQIDMTRTTISLHVAGPDRGLAVMGQPLPNLPGSARAVFTSARQTPEPAIRQDLIGSAETDWVVDGSQSIKFTVARDTGLSLALPK
ncbi:SpoIVB peptidase S55 domain-containing protein [Tundrisphaera lichenicola]|uniref:SpoIVB peptidase S55 domain-containing protein n=1 Tax=Tundrisphaera lichenicola TaxID=2029860 RepID=UPI003EBB5CC8